MTSDALYTVLRHLGRNWGDYGYSIIELTPDYHGGGVAEIAHSDGSRFYIATDRHGAYVGDGETLAHAVENYAVAKRARALLESEA